MTAMGIRGTEDVGERATARLATHRPDVENRSFDHMLGFLDHPDGEKFSSLMGRRFPNPNDITDSSAGTTDILGHR